MIYVCDRYPQCPQRKECSFYDIVSKDEYHDTELGLCYKHDDIVTFSLLDEEYMLKHNGRKIIMSMEGAFDESGT